jgi:vitamin B12/bleomycin/antimicrobial peptide transport system ATP-binding/permease protein
MPLGNTLLRRKGWSSTSLSRSPTSTRRDVPPSPQVKLSETPLLAVVGSWLTWRVGRPLIRLNAERYSREAELRFALVRISECAEGIALYRGESDERRFLHDIVYRVVAIMRRLAGSLAQLTWITSGYGRLAIAVPVLVAAPGYFGGGLSLGGLMMVAGAFYQVQQALRWFVDNFPRIADWRATLLRVVAFRDTLFSLEALHKHVGRIEIVDHPSGNLGLEDLTVFSPRRPGGTGGVANRSAPRSAYPHCRRAGLGQEYVAFLAVAGLGPGELAPFGCRHERP